MADNESSEDELRQQIEELEEALASQVQARIAAEDAVKSLGEQLAKAERKATPGDGPSTIVSPDLAHAALTDPNSGLFTEDFFRVTVDARIAAARRHLRPVAIALVDVVSGIPGDPEPADTEVVGQSLIETLRDSDTAAQLGDGRYALVLEDTPENGAIWTVERVRRHLAQEQGDLTLWAGIACYPAHAFDGAELLRQADEALTGAREWHQDRIEVAHADS